MSGKKSVISRSASGTDRARATFVKTLEQRCNVTEACRAAGIGRSTVYRWREENPAFASAWAEAEEIAADKLEQLAWERAESGESDRMLEILLKGHRPKYRDKQQIEHTGTVGIDHTVEARREIDEIFGPTPVLIEATGG